MRHLALAAMILASLSGPALTQELDVPDVRFPTLPATASSAAGFVPEGWALETEIKGDLDKDGSDDVVLVLRDRDPANVLKPQWAEAGETVDTNPRILAAALATKDGFHLILDNHTLIPRVTSSFESDPLSEVGGVSIDRGSLKVAIYYFPTAGGSDAGFCTFRFRYDGQDFRLIGFDNDNTNRISGETSIVSVNYLTGKATVETGSIGSDKVDKAAKRLKTRKPVGIGDVGEGCFFEPDL